MERNDEIQIDIKPVISPIIKIGLWFQGILIFLIAPVLIYIGLRDISEITFFAVILLGGGILFLFVGKKYLDNVYYKEQITLRPTTLTISIKKIGSLKEYNIDVTEIQYFGFVGDHEYTEHPMDNNVVDFTGLATTERELQFVISNGNIEIESEDEILRFGKNVPSWDAEEIVSKVERYYSLKFKTKYPTDKNDS
jgi:hypothetical protein